jgi:hypothetical protein
MTQGGTSHLYSLSYGEIFPIRGAKFRKNRLFDPLSSLYTDADQGDERPYLTPFSGGGLAAGHILD